MFKTCIDLFLSFLKIGFTSFGGLSMVPLINQEMLSHNWMTQEEVVDIIAIAEMTPGPLGINCAAFCGMRTAGLLGALVSTFGVLFPSVSLTLIVAIFFNKFNKSRGLEYVMVGIRPAAMGMIFAAIVTLVVSNYVISEGIGISFTSIVISLLDLFLFFKFDLDVPIVIGISACLGILSFGFLGLK